MGALDRPQPTLKRYRLSAESYQKLGEVGVLAPDAQVELIDGEIIDMAPIGSRHWSVVNRLHRLIERVVGDAAIVSSQSSFRLDDYSEPQPDIALFRPRADFYATALPTPADTLLVIEVADSSARYDRQIKLPLYARRGVPEFWIVDLDANLLRLYHEPRGDDYLRSSATPAPGFVSIASLPGITVDLSGLLG